MTNIQAIDLLKGLEQSLDDWYGLSEKGKTAFHMAITALDMAIKALEQEHPKGKWIKIDSYDRRDHFYACSECGRLINIICNAHLEDYPFCHCGADMRGAEQIGERTE